VTDFVAYLGAAWLGIAASLFSVSCVCGLLQPYLRHRSAINRDRPPISAILPIKLSNPGFERAQSSLFEQDYPDYEVLVGAAEDASPALDEMRHIASAHPKVPCRFRHSAESIAVSPKLNTIAAPLNAARHDFIFTKDSNITLDARGLSAFMRNFTSGVGLVVAVPVAVRPTNFPGHIEAYLINGHARLLLTASVLGVGFGVGKTMLFRRSDLARAGGIRALSHTLSEDTALAMEFARLGLKTVFCHRAIAQETGARSFAEIYARQLRWSVIRRKNERFTFPLEPLASPLPAAIAAALAAPLIIAPAWAAFAVALAGWFFAETLFAAVKGWEVSPWSPLAFLGREILALSSWLHAFTTYEVVWAERRFDARKGALDETRI